jgi:hypothetical protein
VSNPQAVGFDNFHLDAAAEFCTAESVVPCKDRVDRKSVVMPLVAYDNGDIADISEIAVIEVFVGDEYKVGRCLKCRIIESSLKTHALIGIDKDSAIVVKRDNKSGMGNKFKKHHFFSSIGMQSPCGALSGLQVKWHCRTIKPRMPSGIAACGILPHPCGVFAQQIAASQGRIKLQV